MGQYHVIEKPQEMSWDDIHNLLLKAHADNISKGINMRTTRLSGSELKDRIGNGKCFVALDAHAQLVATAAVSIKTSNLWFAQGRKVASFMLLAILPECRGAGVMKMLDEKRIDFVKRNNLDVVIMDTAESNTKMIDIKQAHGYKKVSLFKSQHSKHFSVVMAKWLVDCPFSDSYIRMHFIIQSIKVKAKTYIKLLLNK